MGMYDVESGKTSKLKKAYVVENGKTVKLKKAYVVENGKLAKLWNSIGDRFIYARNMYGDDYSGVGVMYSEDGVSWNKPVILPDTSSATNIAYGNGCAVVSFSKYNTGFNQVAAYSKDGGETWTILSFTPSVSGNNGYSRGYVSFINGKFRLFLSIYNYSYVDYYSSDDGVNWTFDGRKDPYKTPTENDRVVYAKYNNKYCYILVDSSNQAWYSSDLVEWTQISWVQSSYYYIKGVFVIDDTCYLVANGSSKVMVLQLSPTGTSEVIKKQITTDYTISTVAYNEETRSILISVYYSNQPDYNYIYKYDVDNNEITTNVGSFSFKPYGLFGAMDTWITFHETNSSVGSDVNGYYSKDNGSSWTNIGSVHKICNSNVTPCICYTG